MFHVEGIVGNYELVRVLAPCRTSAAMMYLAVDRRTRRRVALKVVARQASNAARGLVEAERRGAQLQQQLAIRTDLVPSIHEYGESGAFFYVAMQYVEGDDLDKKTGSGRRLPAERAARIARDVCRCLSVAHRSSYTVEGKRCAIVHGDIKPANIRLASDGRLKVLDFGNSVAIGSAHTSAHDNCYTAAYAPPERLQTGVVDAQCDLWALGVVLYEAITGRLPWETSGRGGTASPTTRRGAPPLPRWHPGGIRRIVSKALAPDRGDRYGTADEMRTDLDAFLDQWQRSTATEVLRSSSCSYL